MRGLKEKAIAAFFQINGLLLIVLLIGIFVLLFRNSVPAFREIGITEILFTKRWNPTSFSLVSYGILTQVYSTFLVTVGAMIIAIPLGLATAFYLAEVASPQVKNLLKPAIEMLAGIPSVLVGFLGIVLLGPLLVKVFNLPSGINALNGSMLLAVMALPTIISLAEDAINAVPKSYKSASLALGATSWETLLKVTLPSSLSGLIAAVMLGMGRAIGETMTVLMVTGNALAMPEGYFDSVRTMTATIAIELGEVPHNTTHFYALFAVGLILFFITFVVNLISDIILHKYQEVE